MPGGLRHLRVNHPAHDRDFPFEHRPEHSAESYPNPKLVYAIPIVCFLLASVIRHTGIAGQELIAEPAELVCNYFCTLLGGVIGVLIVLFVQRPKNTACSLLLIPIAMLSLGYFAFSHQGESGTVVGSALITSSRAWLEVCVFAVLVIRMTQGMRMPMAAFVFVGTEVVAGLLRRIAAPLFAQTLGISFDAFAQQASMYLCFILMALCIATLAMLLMRMNSTLIREQQTIESTHRESSLAERFCLTPREASIAGYLIRGHSAPAIAKTEGLSLGTVQTHARNIYSKTGVHSRQELIELGEALAHTPI